MDRNHLIHSYVVYDKQGNIIHYQPSSRDYCQGGHYLSSSAYTYTGKKLKWIYEDGRGYQVNEKGKRMKTWKSYTAIILFETDIIYKGNRTIHVWNGKSKPKLMFRRCKTYFKIAIDSNYKKSPFMYSNFVDMDEADTIDVPEYFLWYATFLYGVLLDYIEKWEKEI